MPQLSRFYREETLGCAFLCFVCHWVNEQVATFLGGSYARGSADAHSDLDLCVITTDGALEEFLAAIPEFRVAEGAVVQTHTGGILQPVTLPLVW